jgi:hypothetical protein
MKAVNITTIKTITTRTNILRVPLESAVCIGCVFDDVDGVSVICEIPTEAEAEDCINGLGGTCAGAGENTLSCAGRVVRSRAAFCVGGETLGTCFGVCAGMGSEFGNGGVFTILGSAEALSIALLFPGVGFFVLGMGEPAAGDGGVALVEGVFASGFPQWGQ